MIYPKVGQFVEVNLGQTNDWQTARVIAKGFDQNKRVEITVSIDGMGYQVGLKDVRRLPTGRTSKPTNKRQTEEKMSEFQGIDDFMIKMCLRPGCNGVADIHDETKMQLCRTCKLDYDRFTATQDIFGLFEWVKRGIAKMIFPGGRWLSDPNKAASSPITPSNLERAGCQFISWNNGAFTEYHLPIVGDGRGIKDARLGVRFGERDDQPIMVWLFLPGVMIPLPAIQTMGQFLDMFDLLKRE